MPNLISRCQYNGQAKPPTLCDTIRKRIAEKIDGVKNISLIQTYRGCIERYKMAETTIKPIDIVPQKNYYYGYKLHAI